VAVALVCALSVVSIGLAIQDIYDKLDRVTIRLCVAEARVRSIDQQLGGQAAGVYVPPHPPERACRAKPGK